MKTEEKEIKIEDIKERDRDRRQKRKSDRKNEREKKGKRKRDALAGEKGNESAFRAPHRSPTPE